MPPCFQRWRALNTAEQCSENHKKKGRPPSLDDERQVPILLGRPTSLVLRVEGGSGIVVLLLRAARYLRLDPQSTLPNGPVLNFES